MSVDVEHINIQFNESQADYTVNRSGEYLIVPVVMMTEGVRAGSGGSILHLSDNYSQNPEDWNSVPVTANHPEKDGQFCSVNSVSQDQWVVGHLRNARIEDDKLKADCYIHEQRAIAVNPEVVNYIEAERKVDVSIGAFTSDIEANGTYENEEYQAITTNYNPDHLALLPGETGACSWSDGCGIRNNKKSKKSGSHMEDNYVQALKEGIRNGEGVINAIQDNQMGFMELSNSIQSQLDRMDSDIRVHFLKEVYDEHFVYKVRNTDTGESQYYQRNYSVDEEEGVEFGDMPQRVRRNVEFVPVQSNKEDDEGCGCNEPEFTRTKFNNNKSNKGDDTMSDKKETRPSSEVMNKIVNLVNNEQTRFSDSDQDWLLELNVNQLAKLDPKEPEEPTVNKEQAVQVLKEDLNDIDEVLKLVNNEVAEKIEKGLDTHKKIREKLTDAIQDNSDEFEEEDLQDMSLSTLEKIEKSVRPVDYSGQGPVSTDNGSPQNNGEEQESLLPAGVGE